MSNPFQNTHAVLAAFFAAIMGLYGLVEDKTILIWMIAGLSFVVGCFILGEKFLGAIKIWKNRTEAGDDSWVGTLAELTRPDSVGDGTKKEAKKE